MNQNDTMLRETTNILNNALKDLDFEKIPFVIAHEKIRDILVEHGFEYDFATKMVSYIHVDLGTMQITEDTIETISIFSKATANVIIQYEKHLQSNSKNSYEVVEIMLINLINKISLTFSE